MAGFLFRSRSPFTVEELVALEGTYIEDLDAPNPVTGVGSGVVCMLAEFDDGPLLTLTEIVGGDITRVFGGLGFNYGGVPANNPCARRRGGELWNGNGFIYSRFISAQRFMVVRVDTSVGEVVFNPQALVSGGKGPFPMAVGDQLAITTSAGTANSAALAATQATQTGTAAISSTGFLGGERLQLNIDSGSPLIVTFSASDQNAAAVVARINAAAGAAIASQASGVLTIKGFVYGTSGSLQSLDGTPGVLTALKLVNTVFAGTGNVANLLIVSAAEIAAIINGTSALNAVGGKARVASDGTLAIYDNNASGSINITASATATKLKIAQTGVTVLAGENAGGVIPAGTRCRDSSANEWVTMVSTTIPAGTHTAPQTGPFRLRVRPSFDDGNAAAASANAVNVLVDQPTFAAFSINNPAAFTAALSEPQVDAAYFAAGDKTTDPSGIATAINYLYCARKSTALDVYTSDQTETTSNTGFAGRKLLRSAPLGATQAQALADRAILNTDRNFYTWPGWQVVIPEILARGAAGGVGFRDDGIVTVRAAGTLAKVCALLPPEENPGQATSYLTQFFATEALAVPLQAADYKVLKAGGICAPRIDRASGPIFQSGVTSDTVDPARQTQARRKMADFIEDSLGQIGAPYCKKLMTEQRQTSLVTDVSNFLEGLLSKNDPNRQRIANYVIDLSANTDDLEALGIYIVDTEVETLSSMDAVVIRTQIGPGTIQVSESNA